MTVFLYRWRGVTWETLEPYPNSPKDPWPIDRKVCRFYYIYSLQIFFLSVSVSFTPVSCIYYEICIPILYTRKLFLLLLTSLLHLCAMPWLHASCEDVCVCTIVAYYIIIICKCAKKSLLKYMQTWTAHFIIIIYTWYWLFVVSTFFHLSGVLLNVFLNEWINKQREREQKYFFFTYMYTFLFTM